MKTAVRSELKSKTYCRSKSYSSLRKQETRVFDFKFYQKLFIVLVSLSTFLILPESPRELESICERYNPSKLCNVW